MKLQELKRLRPDELLAKAEEAGVENASSLLKQEMVFAILKKHAEEGNEIVRRRRDRGAAGRLRLPALPGSQLPGRADDIYVAPSIVKSSACAPATRSRGPIRAPKNDERYFALNEVKSVNFEPVENLRHRVNFDNLTPLYPEQRLKMEYPDLKKKEDLTKRVIDLIVPQGKGQRTLVVAPPRVGKTMMLQNIAHSITTNHPECFLIVLLVDERPEEVTDMAAA